MEKQQEQKNQNQEVEYISAFLDEDEEVNESEFDEPTRKQETDKLADSQQNKTEEEEKPKRPKRTRKTIEQEIAELDAKRERLMEKKRRQEAYEKIVFGATIIAMLKDMKFKSENDYKNLCDKITRFSKTIQTKDNEIIVKIIEKIDNKLAC